MMNFNPANFDVSQLSREARKVREQADDEGYRAPVAAAHPLVAELRAAAQRFGARRDSFAVGKEMTCLDLASKLERYGVFASDKQADFANKLVEWSKPRQYSAVIEATVPAPLAVLPKLFALMQRLSKLTIGELQIARKNQDSLCWVKVVGQDGVFGKIENGTLVLFAARLNNAGRSVEAVRHALVTIEADPEAAAVLHGKASGCCSVCSRDLTDPESIERGIGPICAGKF